MLLNHKSNHLPEWYFAEILRPFIFLYSTLKWLLQSNWLTDLSNLTKYCSQSVDQNVFHTRHQLIVSIHFTRNVCVSFSLPFVNEWKMCVKILWPNKSERYKPKKTHKEWSYKGEKKRGEGDRWCWCWWGTMCKMNKRNRPRDQIFNPILSILCAL